MSGAPRPTGHLQVKPDGTGQARFFYGFWRDQHGVRGGRQLGPAHPLLSVETCSIGTPRACMERVRVLGLVERVQAGRWNGTVVMTIPS
jgi:hypothetical protein